MPRSDLNLRMADLGRFYIGITEIGGANAGAMVEEFQRAVDGRASGEPWCMAFLQFLAKQTQAAHGGRARVFPSESVKIVWDRTMPAARVLSPTPGAWALWRHGNTDYGHCGLIVDVFPDYFITVEGNTAGMGAGIVREGDGVYLKRRPWDNNLKLSTVGDMKLLGFLQVFE